MEPLAQQFTGLRVKMITALHLEALKALNPAEAKQNVGFAPHLLRRGHLECIDQRAPQAQGNLRGYSRTGYN
ncbi:hypothetical protein TB1_031404 [Malus domestica]